jgi:hypothetical protein
VVAGPVGQRLGGELVVLQLEHGLDAALERVHDGHPLLDGRVAAEPE